MPEKFESRYFHGEGKSFIGDRLADGSPKDLMFIGDCSSVEITPDIQRNDVVEKITGNSSVATSYIANARYNISIAMRSVKPSHLIHALQGTQTDIASDSVTDERHTVVVGGFYPLKYLGVSNESVTLDPDGTATALTADTDYKLHADEGLIEILSGGSVSDGDEIGVDYDYGAQSRLEADPTNVEKYFHFNGINKADGDRFVRCDVYKLRLSPSSISPVTDDRQDITLEGQVENDMQRAAGDRLFNWQFDER
jgi:hypothetical protein